MQRALGSLVVALVLVGLSFLNDAAGYLGTDTGGKTATLEAMTSRGDWSVDVGYWAEDVDPDGRYHPLYGTTPTDEGWAQVTSVPMILAARPLWELGGYRAALLLPIAGTVLAALAAARLAERMSDRRTGTWAFWIFGLASPLTIYGLDLWEHSLGVAAIGWAAVLLLDVVDRRPGAQARAAGAGAVLALAATMRTEALVYTLIFVGGACAWLVRRSLAAAVATGSAAVAGFVPVWAANRALELAVSGNSRTARATGVASSAGDEAGARLEEGIRTTFGASATDAWSAVAVGIVLVVLVAAAVAAGDRVPEDRRSLVAVALVAVAFVVVAPGLGFVPGLFPAFPVAAAGLAWNRLPAAARAAVVAAAVALPVVWAFQFLGGAGPQWGGRYVLTSALLLGVAGVVALMSAPVPPAISVAVVAMSVLVTGVGLAWLHERSHDVDGLFDWVVDVQDEALIARNPFFLRESGPVALEHRWLSAADPSDLEGPAEVLARVGVDRFSVLQVAGEPEPDLPGTRVVSVDRRAALGVVFEVVHLQAT